MTKIISYIKKDGSIQYKNILILLLSVILIFTYRGYREKSKFEDSYNEEFYMKFNMHYLSEDSTLVQYLKLTDKALNQEELSGQEIENLDRYWLFIISLEHDLIDFYSKHYKGQNEDKIQYNREVLIDFFHNHSPLREITFEPIPHSENTYRLKDSVLKKKQTLYLSEKINAILELLDAYKQENIEKYKTYKNPNHMGRDFVKSGVWMDLLKDIATTIVSIEKSYNFGTHAPTEIIAEEYGYIPDELTKELFLFTQRRGYKILTGDFGIYLYASTYGHRKEFEIISANRIGNQVTISINTKGTLESGANNNFTTLTALLRGLDPNDMYQLQFKVTDERGVPLPKIKE